MRGAVGSDHAGLDLKEILKAELAALGHDVAHRRAAGQHNHANVVCFGARTTGTTVVIDALRAFLQAPQGPTERNSRHLGRIEKLAALDRAARDGTGTERELVHHTAPEGTT
jgi:ribose 5-phosphate isomerase RpiB